MLEWNDLTPLHFGEPLGNGFWFSHVAHYSSRRVAWIWFYIGKMVEYRSVELQTLGPGE